MSYLTKEEAKEYRAAKRFLGVEFGKLLIVLLAISMLFGIFGVGYHLTVGKQMANAKREVFESNKSYVHGMTEDLARHKLELSKSTDDVERKAIISYITENYANFDGKLIENDSLREFYYDVMEGRIQ